VGHEVEQHPDSPGAGLGHQPVDVLQSAEDGLDGAVVDYVVAPVGVGRDGDGADPDRVDAEPGQVVEPFHDAGQVAHPVAVRVGKRPRIDLVDDAGLPPRLGHGRAQPPETAGRTTTSLPSGSGVASASRSRTLLPSTNTLTWRRSRPCSSRILRSRAGWATATASRRAPRSAPARSSRSSTARPPAKPRRAAGTRRATAVTKA